MMTESRRVFLLCPKCGMRTAYVYNFEKVKQVIFDNRLIICDKCHEEFQIKINLSNAHVAVV